MADLYSNLVGCLLLIVEGILHLKQQQLKKNELANKAAQLEKIRKNNE